MKKHLHFLKGSLLLLTLACSPFVSHAQTQASVAAYDCSAQSQIPAAECNALKDLFASTAGESWTNNNNWGTGNPGDWAGVALIGVAPNQNVNSLSLDNNNLVGNLNSSLGNLTEVQQLNFSQNSLTGSIPSSFSALTNMRRLFLFNNQLSSGIPDIFGGWTNVLLVSIAENPNLGGTIPSSLGSNNSLERLFLQNSGLTGTIPSNLGNLTNLALIDLSSNQLAGAIPLSFGNDPATPANVNFSSNQLDADVTGVALTPGALAAWAAGGVQRTLNNQAASSGPVIQASSVPASPLWSLVIMSFALLLVQRAKLTSRV
ncbi:hypothetical protein [Pseudoteredinibacter isoporae]|uniref:Uncharacterized protein n=1 Tax=Pseudoteredinibacter isoporae TaxID=570281 RepID=A0A7X0JSZ9_9GAMM|nr:hypothetical protein [Pseudoteredinibacter isoporae]MBB6521138.1 hypothetical protein [Pseudoteredinibacter isoporae]NHO86699.1 hypothetical protein [Pseudoteredinibacter isoporae]NIB24849.1 hypothetical protein [Pseudoteredinibacter isoporae]